jgi:hypothetical protein
MNRADITFINLIGRKKCIWCGKEFNEEILRKTEKDYSAMMWFTSEFLVHAQTTHGYSPDVIDIMLKELKNEILNNNTNL